MNNLKNTKYIIKYTSKFKKQFKKIMKQGKNEQKFLDVLEYLANGKELPKKYRNHHLINSGEYLSCNECHIEPDWLLVYKIQNEKLILLLFATGSHSEIFK